ncbi:MAG: hypothetical protein K0Q43_2308 [Ramlibacter sp.]|jgi:hypothetical protein|nr:hypothetical protein [Ramlibacter sp.]
MPVWLFVSYGGGHVKALLPVAQRVRELGIAEPVYLALTTAAAMVEPTGLRTLGLRDAMTPADERARRKGEELAGQLQVQAADREESIAYLGLSYIEMEERLGVAAAADQFRKFGRQAFLPLGILERILQQLRPALVVATNSPRAEQAALQAARAMGIPGVCLVDLLGIWERDLLASPCYADAVCVLNEAVRDSLVRAGRPASQVHVTGNPAFDTVNDPAMLAAGARFRTQAGWDELYVCLYASSPEPAGIPGVDGTGDPTFPRRIEEALIAAVEANPNLALWVRRHPSEARADDISAANRPRVRVAPPEMPLHACIHASDEVIVTVSTVGVEAHLAGKRVTQVRGSILDHLSPYLQMGIADRELTVAALPQAYAAQHSPAAASARRPLEAVGNATGRVVEVLRSVATPKDGHGG